MRSFITLLASFFLAIFSIANPTIAFANMDPVSATSSATATVPAGTPTTGDITAPSVPILVRPEDGTFISDNKREFVWKVSTDIDSNTILYTLYLNGTATYLGISNNGNSAGNGYATILENGEVRLTPTIALSDGQYDWYVTASDLSGNTSHSATWHLTVDTTPPDLEIQKLDQYEYPVITEGSNFDITGPKTINFKIHTESFARIQLSVIGQDLNQVITTGASGLAYPYLYLTPGIYTISLFSTDRSGNTTFLPDFTLTITQAQITVTIPTGPGSSSTPVISIPYTPISLPSFSATISQISTRRNIAPFIYSLLALLLLILLVFLYNSRSNLYLVDETGSPIHNATIYHSNPRRTHFASPILYKLKNRDHGTLYIKNLSRGSTLTIKIDNRTVILSLAVTIKKYTIVLA